jgi:hypothetical protein
VKNLPTSKMIRKTVKIKQWSTAKTLKGNALATNQVNVEIIKKKEKT